MLTISRQLKIDQLLGEPWLWAREEASVERGGLGRDPAARSEQLPIFEIARVLGIARNTVKAALASDSPPKYQRAPTGSVVDGAGQSSPDASRMYWPLPARRLPTAAAAANSLNGARPGSKADGAKVAAATASGPMLFLNVIADGALRRCG